jgi:hypothetical protein
MHDGYCNKATIHVSSTAGNSWRLLLREGTHTADHNLIFYLHFLKRALWYKNEGIVLEISLLCY